MSGWQLGLLVGLLVTAAIGLIFFALHLHNDDSAPKAPTPKAPAPSSSDKKQFFVTQAEDDVEHIFNDSFREELRNRGRLHFEKIITENAMFLQQDLRLTTSQLNDYLKEEISKTLKNEFSKYEESIADAKQVAIDAIQKTQAAIEQQRGDLEGQLKQQIDAEKEQIINRFKDNMGDIVNHYVTAAIGNQIDLVDQLEYILGEFEDNKQAIIEDIRHGA